MDFEISSGRQQKIRVLMFSLLLIGLASFASVAEAVYSLPTDRSVTWEGNVGVRGDIPFRTTIYTTVSPSGGDDTSAIQTAIDDCPLDQVVMLDAGTFNVSSPVSVKSGITLRGAGMGNTIVKGVSGMSGAFVVGFNSGNFLGTSIDITEGLSKGSCTITTGTEHGWNIGDIILIDQLNDAEGDPVVTNVGFNGTCTWCGRSRGTRSLGQISKVVEIPTATTATLEIPLYWNYSARLNPQATQIAGITANAGIEDLTVDNSLSGSSSQTDDGATIAHYGTSNCWLLRVEAIGSYTSMIRMYRSYRDTIRSCKFHEGVPALPVTGSQYGNGRAYSIFMNPASACLIENNEIYHLTGGPNLNGPASGNVIAYNYITALYYSSSLNWQPGVIIYHGGHAFMNLFESNYSQSRILADNVWGSSSHNTFFRNRNTLDPDRPFAAWDVDLYKNATYYNIVGNVIGLIDFEDTYELNNVDFTTERAIYRFGYTFGGDNSASGNDPQPYATVLRHGNWDSVTNGITWNGSDDQDLPASLYLSSQPSWWRSMHWPPIGADISPMFPAAPAAGNGTPWTPVPISITTTDLSTGTVGVVYRQTLTATGGTQPYTWALAAGSLPDGLTLSDDGVISGTPTTAGDFHFTVQVSAASGDTANQALIISVVPGVSITTAILPGGTVGVAYSQVLAATGGTTPYVWSLAAGSLPEGLTLSSDGVISGTPTTAGSFDFTVQVSDANGGTATKALAVSINTAVSITTNFLSSGTVGVAYSQTLAATGGTQPYTWALAAGSLPAGLTLSGDGVISGTPTTVGSFEFTVQASDANGGTATKALAVSINTAVSITTNSLSSGTVGVAYSQTLAATGGTQPYTWALAAGSLPAGLTLSGDGVISGTPTTAGSFNFTVRVVAANGGTATRALSIIIALPAPVSITTTSLPVAIRGILYSQSLTATGAITPYSWARTSGTLPTGLTLSSAGVISGTPAKIGTFNFTVRVTAANGSTATRTLSIAVAAVQAPTNLTGAAIRISGNSRQDLVTLNWTDNASNESGFQIQRSTSSSFSRETIYKTGRNVTTFSQKISRSENYYYRVRATSGAGYSNWSNVLYVTTP